MYILTKHAYHIYLRNENENEKKEGDKMRATTHNGRGNKKGQAFPAKHNDRIFDLKKAKHIDEEKTKDNFNWKWNDNQKGNQSQTFVESEKMFYEEHFTKFLEAQNERYRKSGHKERMKTMDEYMKKIKTCPESAILQVGKQGETIDADLLKRITIKYIQWEMNTFPNVKILNASMHVDEPDAAPHFHERKVWIAHDRFGNEMVNQEQALKEMGIEAPKPDKPINRYNNAKMTYTKMCRDKYIEICKEHGLELELEPLEASKTGLEHDEYKRRQEEEKRKKAIEERDIAVSERNEAILEKDKAFTERDVAIEERNKAFMERDKALTECDELSNFAKDLESECNELSSLTKNLQKQRDSIVTDKAVFMELYLKEIPLQNGLNALEDCNRQYEAFIAEISDRDDIDDSWNRY